MYYINDMGVFDKKLRQVIAERKIQQKTICLDLGFNQGTFSKWCNGSTKPNIEDVVRIADYLDLKTDYLLKENTATKKFKPVSGEKRRDYDLQKYIKEIIEYAINLEVEQRIKMIRIAQTCFEDDGDEYQQ
jgi:transcriptional regulator with XRE-family HTH domain